MKSSAPTAIALTLLMLLLVLAAAVFFLFQNQQSLKGDLQSANAHVRSVEKQQAEIELKNSAAQSTLDALEASGTVSAAENVGLVEQLANSDQLKLTKEAKETQLTTDLGNANATIESFESQKPLITLVNPDVDKGLVANQPVELVIVATDHDGVNSINFSIGSEPFLHGGIIEDSGLTAIQRHTWTPDSEGPIEIKITATNINGISNEQTITYTIISAATETPEPAEDQSATATVEN